MKCCESICKTVLGGRGDWKTGKTKMFLKVLPDLSVLDVLGLFQRMKGEKAKTILVTEPVMQIRIQRWRRLIR